MRSNDGLVAMSSLTLAELQRGLLTTEPNATLRAERLEDLLTVVPVVAFDASAARVYGRIIRQLGWARGVQFDRLIAAHAIALGCILITANVGDFSGIPNLRMENWAG